MRREQDQPTRLDLVQCVAIWAGLIAGTGGTAYGLYSSAQSCSLLGVALFAALLAYFVPAVLCASVGFSLIFRDWWRGDFTSSVP